MKTPITCQTLIMEMITFIRALRMSFYSHANCLSLKPSIKVFLFNVNASFQTCVRICFGMHALEDKKIKLTIPRDDKLGDVELPCVRV